MELLQSQIQKALEIIYENGFNPKDFNFNKTDGNSVIRFKKTNYYFSFRDREPSIIDPYDRATFVSSFSPGEKTLIEKLVHKNFDAYWNNLFFWLQFLKREIQAENDLKIFMESFQNINFDEIKEDELINAQDKIWIKSVLDGVVKKLPELGATKEIINKIERDNDEILKKADKFTKKDFLLFLYGYLLNKTFDFALKISSLEAQKLWVIIMGLFQSHASLQSPQIHLT
jgi:hypothetical protein